mgnify:CR=1 FL=1
MLLDQRIVPGRVVGDPVQDDVHAQLMGLSHELLEAVQVAELGVHTLVIPYGIGAAEPAFALRYADFLHRHQPQDVYAKIFEPWKLLFRGGKSPLRRELACVDLVDDRIAAPLRVFDLDIGFRHVGFFGESGFHVREEDDERKGLPGTGSFHHLLSSRFRARLLCPPKGWPGRPRPCRRRRSPIRKWHGLQKTHAKSAPAPRPRSIAG